MSIALPETGPSARGAPDSSRIVASPRLYLGVIAVLALVVSAAFGLGAVSAPVETGGKITAVEGGPPAFDGRGKWSGY